MGYRRSVLSEAELLSPSGRGEVQAGPKERKRLKGGGGIGMKKDSPTRKGLQRAQGPKEDGNCSPYR